MSNKPNRIITLSSESMSVKEVDKEDKAKKAKAFDKISKIDIAKMIISKNEEASKLK